MSQKIITIIYFSLIITASILFSLLYVQSWDPMWNPFRASPNVVIAEMGVKMAQVKTCHSALDFEIGIKNEEEFNINGNIKVEADITDSDSIKSATEFKFYFTAEGMELSLAGENKTIDDVSYFKLTTIPAFPYLDDFKNQWVKIDQESLGKIAGEEYQPPEEDQKMEELIEDIKEVLGKAKMFKVKEELADEEINNQKVYHYMVVLDKEGIKVLIPEIIEKMAEYTPELEEFYKELDDFFEKTGEIDAEIWIGKKDKLPYRIKFEKEIDISKFDETQDGIIIIKANIEMSAFDQPKNIEAPQNFKTIDSPF